MPVKQKDKTSDHVNDAPALTEDHWYSLAVGSAILTAVAVFVAFGWIFFDGFDGEADVRAAQALAPFGVALFALVTFCTVGWRGTISRRQADQSEREGRAKLLQEGAKLLGEKENPSHVSAGVATLEILISGEDEKLAIQAMNLIADYIQNEMGQTHEHRFREETFAALATGDKRGRSANRKVKFARDPIAIDGTDDGWYPLLGVKEVQYVGGKAEGFWGEEFKDNRRFSYSRVQLNFLDGLKLTYRFRDCTFKYCEIAKYESRTLSTNEPANFQSCNFSECDFDQMTPIPDFRKGGNYFRPPREPRSGLAEKINWTDHFVLKTKHTDF